MDSEGLSPAPLLEFINSYACPLTFPVMGYYRGFSVFVNVQVAQHITAPACFLIRETNIGTFVHCASPLP